mgnify:CR=1 FL=1
MGTGSSVVNISKLECPNNYDKDKFQIILSLFEKLDKNDDLILELNELKEISNKHINNRILLLEKEQDKEKKQTKTTIEVLEFNKQKHINELELSFISKKKDYEKKLENRLNNINKSKAFINVVSYNNKNIDFWKFFTYMKDKIHDIRNLV